MVLTLSLIRDKPRRFNALRRDIEGVTQKMLSQTLKQMERDGWSPGPFCRRCRFRSNTRSRSWARRSLRFSTGSSFGRATTSLMCLPPGGFMTGAAEVSALAGPASLHSGSIITLMQINPWMAGERCRRRMSRPPENAVDLGGDQSGDIGRVSSRFGGGDKARPDPHATRSGRESCGHALVPGVPRTWPPASMP